MAGGVKGDVLTTVALSKDELARAEEMFRASQEFHQNSAAERAGWEKEWREFGSYIKKAHGSFPEITSKEAKAAINTLVDEVIETLGSFMWNHLNEEESVGS